MTRHSQVGHHYAMLTDAIVGWLVQIVGDRLLRGLDHGLRGRPARRALSKALDVAVSSALTDVPESVRGPLLQALAERFGEPPALPLDGRTSVRAGLVAAIRAQLAPLDDPALTPHGRSFLEEIGVDGRVLQDRLPPALIRAVEQVAVAVPELAPLAAQLNADRILKEFDDARNDRNDPSPADRGAEPAYGAGLPAGVLEELVDAFSGTEAMAADDSRDLIIRQLSRIAGNIPRSRTPRIQVILLIRTCLHYDDGLAELLRQTRLVEGDSPAMRRVERLVAELPARAEPC